MRVSVVPAVALALVVCPALGLGVGAGPLLVQKTITTLDGDGGGDTPFDDGFRSLVADVLAAWHVPGVAVAVVDGDATWTEGFGQATVAADASHRQPVTPDTLFYTASTTKAFLAATLSLLIDSGDHAVAGQALDWTTPIADILPDDFVLTDGDAWATRHTTLEDALAHRTGLAGHDHARARRYGLAADTASRNATVRDVTRSLRHLPAPLQTPPRTRYRYCNLMFLVLSHVAETLTGRWLGDVFRERLWAPLGMHATFLSLDDARASGHPLAQGYYHDAAHDRYVPVPHMPLDEVSGAGGTISTVRDYAAWLRCWIDASARSNAACGGIPFTKGGLDAILAPKIFTTATAASPAPFDAPVAYASAWTTSSYHGHRFWGHSGGSNAFGAQVYFFPDDRFGVVLFGNTAVSSNKAELELLWHLVDERFGVPRPKRHDWRGQLTRAADARAHRVATALDALFPDRAQPPRAPALPLADYTGTFHHPAYQNMTVRLAPPNTTTREGLATTFTAARLRHTWPTLCEFVHVSGEHWLVYTDMVYEKSGYFRSYARAHFEVGASGRADRLLVAFWSADDDALEGVIPFDRVDDKYLTG